MAKQKSGSREISIQMVDYADVIVQKPWGHEYLCYRNRYVAIWFLHIHEGKQTSMHCHPNKSTGFVMLEGRAELSFLRNTIHLRDLDKIHIFRSRFHSTKALSDAYIFEIETPENKNDLVRLYDAYGRAGTEYEGSEHYIPKDQSCFWLADARAIPELVEVKGCRIGHQRISALENLVGRPENAVFVVTEGGLISKRQEKILWPGDVIDGKTLIRLATTFDFLPESSLMTIEK